MTSSIRRITRKVLSVAVETVYPKVCAGCGMRGAWLCDSCEFTVPAASQPNSCLRCGVPLVGNHCGCADLDHLISLARSAYVYDGWAATSVKRMKYHGEPARAEFLAMQMVSEIPMFGAIDGFIPVPLHPSREKQRGYNQARLLAEHLSTSTGIPVLDVIRRTRKSVSQTTLSGRDRKQNVSGIFELDTTWVPPGGRRYVLVDDVRTTGATLNACAEALRSIRPAMIGALTFALDMSRDAIEDLRHDEATRGTRVAIGPAASPGSGLVPSGPPQGRHRGP